ncbi:MAG: hypothetical protein ACKO7Z_05315 [Cyanobacteriota bacterium]
MAQPHLPAFCRTRGLRSQGGPCRAGASLPLLYVLLALQLSTVLLVLAGPVPPAAAPLLQPVESRP